MADQRPTPRWPARCCAALLIVTSLLVAAAPASAQLGCVPADCSDGLFCNGSETCSATLGCQAGTPVSCGDSVACTADTCNETLDLCEHTMSDAACSDGLFCDGVETCNATLGCQLGTLETCDDGVSCTVDLCNVVSDQCDHTPVDLTCSDGQFCNGTETCNPTLGCQAGSAVDCADTVDCTTDSCNETLDLCTHTGVDAACSDGLYCDGTETCNVLLGCLPGSPSSVRTS